MAADPSHVQARSPAIAENEPIVGVVWNSHAACAADDGYSRRGNFGVSLVHSRVLI